MPMHTSVVFSEAKPRSYNFQESFDGGCRTLGITSLQTNTGNYELQAIDLTMVKCKKAWNQLF